MITIEQMELMLGCKECNLHDDIGCTIANMDSLPFYVNNFLNRGNEKSILSCQFRKPARKEITIKEAKKLIQ